MPFSMVTSGLFVPSLRHQAAIRNVVASDVLERQQVLFSRRVWSLQTTRFPQRIRQ